MTIGACLYFSRLIFQMIHAASRNLKFYARWQQNQLVCLPCLALVCPYFNSSFDIQYSLFDIRYLLINIRHSTLKILTKNPLSIHYLAVGLFISLFNLLHNISRSLCQARDAYNDGNNPDNQIANTIFNDKQIHGDSEIDPLIMSLIKIIFLNINVKT